MSSCFPPAAWERIVLINVDFPHPFSPCKNTRSPCISSKDKLSRTSCLPFSYPIVAALQLISLSLWYFMGYSFSATGFSMSCSNPSFSWISLSIRFSYCFTLDCIFLVFAPIYALVLMHLSGSFKGSNPIFVLSFLSAHLLLWSTDFRSAAISRRCFSFSIFSKLSLRVLFSHQLVKLPLWTSMEFLFNTRTWSMQASRISLSWDTRINPFFPDR